MAEEIRPEDRAMNAEIREDIAETERDAAMLAAANEAARGNIAADEAIDARIEANRARAAEREMATHSNILHSQLASERAAASNNAFGFYLMVGLVLAVLIVGAFYVYWWQPNNPQSVNIFAAPPAQQAPVINTPPAQTSPTIVTPPVTNPSPPPVIVNPKPPEVHNHIQVTPPPAENPTNSTEGTNPTGGTSGSSSGDNGNP